jgi:hypothetical protein
VNITVENQDDEVEKNRTVSRKVVLCSQVSERQTGKKKKKEMRQQANRREQKRKKKRTREVMVVEGGEEDDLSSFVQNQKKVLNKTEAEIR